MPTHLTLLHRAILVSLALTLSPMGPALAQSPTATDLQALRFYLDQQNNLAVNAELRRLQIQFPDWTPPSDMSQLFSNDGPDSIDQIYRLIAAGSFDEARALIAETDRAFATWSPPSDLLSLLSLSEGQAEFSAAVAAGQVETAIGIIRGIPALLSCERVNNAWELAEMHLLRGDTAQAIGIYRSVLRSCSDPSVLVATLEKADIVANLSELEEMSDIAQGQNASAVSMLRQTEDRLRAGRQVPSRWGNDEQVIALETEADAASDRAAQPPPPAPTPPTPQPAPAPAAQATATPPAAPAGAPAAPQTAAPQTAGLGAVERAAQRGAWGECLALSSGSANVNVIFQRGWCAFNADRSMEAIAAFQRVAQMSSSANVRRDASYGWMLSLLKLNMTEQAAQLAAATDLTRTQRIEIEGQILDQRGVRAYENRDYARAAAFFAAHQDLTGHMRRDLALLRGYALLNQGKTGEAREIFMTLHRQLATSETRSAIAALD